MNYNETLDFIHSLGNFSLPAGTDRIENVLKLLGSPQNSLRAIHIAGTNGKGSVSAMLSRIFTLSGYKTALFISPYIIDFRERIQINENFISEDDLVRYSQRVLATGVQLTEFEFITAVAFLYFAEQKCDILICETGLGGRLDATNTLDNLAAAVITKIGLDHTAILGDTIEQIAREKCGILRDCPTVSAPFQERGAIKVIEASSKHLTVPDIGQLKIIEKGITNTFIYKDEKYTLSLSGEFQIANAITVIEAVKVSGYDISIEILRKALATTTFPARMEIFSKNPLLVLDGAHNPDGAAELSVELRKYAGESVAIVGMMRDKDCETVLKETLPYCKNTICVEVPEMPRSLTSTELCSITSEFCSSETAADIESAVYRALELSKGNPIFVFGSLYLAAEARPILKNFFKNY